MLEDMEKSRSGNQMIKSRMNKIRPPRPYLVNAARGIPRGVGRVCNDNNSKAVMNCSLSAAALI